MYRRERMFINRNDEYDERRGRYHFSERERLEKINSRMEKSCCDIGWKTIIQTHGAIQKPFVLPEGYNIVTLSEVGNGCPVSVAKPFLINFFREGGTVFDENGEMTLEGKGMLKEINLKKNIDYSSLGIKYNDIIMKLHRGDGIKLHNDFIFDFDQDQALCRDLKNTCSITCVKYGEEPVICNLKKLSNIIAPPLTEAESYYRMKKAGIRDVGPQRENQFLLSQLLNVSKPGTYYILACRGTGHLTSEENTLAREVSDEWY